MLETIYNGSYLIASILIIVYIGFYVTKRENTNIRVALACTMAVIAISWIFLDIFVEKPAQPIQRDIFYIAVWMFFIIVEFLDLKKNRRK